MKKYFLDISLLVIFLLVMSFYFLPRDLHEIFGAVMFVAAIWHLILNRRQFLNLFRGKLSGKKIFSALINFSMLAIFLTVFVTGVCISNHLFHDFISLELRRNITIHQLHKSLPYLLTIFFGLHIGLHWFELWNRFTNFLQLKKNSLRYKIFCRLSILLIIFFGVYGSILNRVGDRILMEHIFATSATELPWIAFLFLFLATLGIYSIIAYFIDKKFFK